MSGLCGNCRHWDKEGAFIGWDIATDKMRRCNGVHTRWDIADNAAQHSKLDEMDTDEWIEMRKHALVDAKACVNDGSEYYAELLTTADFGCVLFEEKTDDPS